MEGHRSKANSGNCGPYAGPLSAEVPAVTGGLACAAAAGLMQHLTPDEAPLSLPFQNSFSVKFLPETTGLWARYFKQNPHWRSKRVWLDSTFWPEVILLPVHCKGCVTECTSSYRQITPSVFVFLWPACCSPSSGWVPDPTYISLWFLYISFAVWIKEDGEGGKRRVGETVDIQM